MVHKYRQTFLESVNDVNAMAHGSANSDARRQLRRGPTAIQGEDGRVVVENTEIARRGFAENGS